MRHLLLALVVSVGSAFAAVAAPCAGSLCADGFLALRSASAKGPESWIGGGFGPLSPGGHGSDDRQHATSGEVRLAVEWNPLRSLTAHVHGLAASEQGRDDDLRGGIVEGWLEVRHELSIRQSVRARGGVFFLPTSLENTEPLWTSPYTLSFSALNSWIAEELRPTAVDLEYRLDAGLTQWSIAGTAFRGADSLGALLAWRGWSMGNRLSTFDETVPLPPLPSLADSGSFHDQNDGGTRPMERDLDGRTGWAVRARGRLLDRVRVQASHIDNRGDRALHRGEYAWATRFDVIGLAIDHGDSTLLVEWTGGESGMGKLPAVVQIDFRAAYVLLSHRLGPMRWSARYDNFRVIDRDGFPGDNNDETGHAWATALFWEPAEALRVGLEYLDLSARRPALEPLGLPRLDSRAMTAELRYSF